MENHSSSLPKNGRRKLDAFERFEKRPKRRPLGDITNHQNQPQNRPKTSRLSKDATLASLARSAASSSNHNPSKFINPFSFFEPVQKNHSECRLPAVRQLSNAFGGSQRRIPEQKDKKRTDSQPELKPSPLVSELFDASKSVLYAGHKSSSGVFRGSVPRTISYNAVVARSNALVRKHCDGARLEAGGKSQHRGDTAGHVLPIILKVSSPSEFLRAVTTDSGDEFLLANTEKVEPVVGSRLVLGAYTGTVPKMYTSWRLE